MERHKLGTSLGTLKPICELIRVGKDPVSTPVIFQTVGTDLNGIPIEAGFGSAVWTWDTLPQEDYDFLLELQGDVPGVAMEVYTSKRSGASGIDFDNFACIMGRPVMESREGLICRNVKIEFTRMI